MNAEADARAVNPWLVLVIACLAQFMVVLDATVVNVALPSIQRGLHFSASSLRWVVNAYTLIFGGFLLLGGRAADLLGRKRLFVVGVVLFSVASLLNGLAQSSTMLIAGRGLQGLGGALVSPAALSIVTTTFTDQTERTRALGVWSAIAAGGGAVGLLLGGVLTDLASWPWIFIVNVPVGVITVALAMRFVPETRVDVGHRSFDLAGAVTVTAGLVVLVFAIVKAQAYGWGSGRTIGLLAAGAALIAAFVAIERRSAAPLMRLSIFRVRTLTVADTVLLLVAAGMVVLTQLPVNGSYVSNLLPGLVPLSIGMGLTFVPITLLGTGGVTAKDSGLASGLFNTAQQVGSSLGLAILSTLAASQTSSLIHGHPTPAATLAARVSGYHVAFAAAAIMLAIGGALLALGLRKRHVQALELTPSPAAT